MPLTDGEVFAGYVIQRLLGAGGMGEVYLARHPRLPRLDALKILRADLTDDADYRQRFHREADLAATLSHPRIVGVYDRGEFNGRLWISMDYVEGTDAGRLVRDNYPAGMPERDVRDIVTAVAEALDFAHRRRLLHRDVKPANILLTEPDDDERRVLLADFGIARQVDDVSGLTATNMTVGSVAYAAPEQLMGEQIDGRADQYALAATAFTLLSGAPPFPQTNPAVVIGKHLNTPAPSLAGHRPELAHLDTALSTAMAKDPNDRYPRCLDFARALGQQDSATPVPDAGTAAAPTQYLNAPPTPVSTPPSSSERTAPPPPPPPASPPPPPAGNQELGPGEALPPPPWYRRPGILIAAAFATIIATIILIAALPSPENTAPSDTTEMSTPSPTAPPPLTSTLAAPPTTSMITVPKVIGLTAAAARSTLEDAGLNVIERQEDSGQSPGTVIRSEPGEGDGVKPGNTITIYVATAPTTPSITVPNVIGLTAAAARSTLEDAGLNVIERQEDSGQSPGTVIRSEPGEGDGVKPGNTITIYVATAPTTPSITVPNVIGLTAAAARSTLEDAGLNVIERQEDSGQSPGTVIRSEPGEGSGVKPGDTITIYVATPPTTTTTTTTTDTTPPAVVVVPPPPAEQSPEVRESVIPNWSPP